MDGPEELPTQEVERGDPLQLAGAEVRQLAEHGEAQPRLTDETGAADHKRNHEAGPRPRGLQRTAQAGHQDRGDNREADHPYAEFDQQSQPECQPQEQQSAPGPAPPSSRASDSSAKVQLSWSSTTGWNRLAERRKRGLAILAQRRECLGPPAAAKLPGHQGGQHDESGAGHGGHQPDADQRIA